MAITQADIKLLESERMSDSTDGGGRKTSRVIPDGVAGNIFPKVSRLDAVYGRVNLRKIYGAVQTADVDVYAGAHAIISDGPDNLKINCTLFSTSSDFDTRSGAKNRIEAYLNKGSVWSGFLLENHIAGQKSIQIMQREGSSPPPIGRTLCLVVNEGQVNQAEQYVRVTRVASEVRQFAYSASGGWLDYQATVVTCDLTEALRYDFPGTPPNRAFTPVNGASIIRDTLVADAAAYFGIAPVAQAILAGESKVKVASIYSQLVPSSQSETAMVDIRPSAQWNLVLASAPREVTVGGASCSQRIRVGQENRGFNYVSILTPAPAPGSVYITYRALGRNYKITDDGNGNLIGMGSGTINYLTGSVSVTLQALPDDRSAVVFYWGPNAAYTNRSGSVAFRAPEYTIPLQHNGVEPGSVVVTWTSGGNVKTATDNASGKLTGDASGEVNYVAGLLYIKPALLPDADSQFSLNYSWSTLVEELKGGVAPDGVGVINIALAQVPIPGTVEVQWLTNREVKESSGANISANTTTKTTDSGTKDVGSVERFTASYSTSMFDLYPAGIVPANNGMAVQRYFPQLVQTSIPYAETVKTTYQQSASNSASHTTNSTQSAFNAVTVHHIVTDDGAGGLFGAFGTVSYAGQAIAVKVTANYEESSYSSNSEQAGSWESLNATDKAVNYSGFPAASEGGGGSASTTGGQSGSIAKTEVFSGNSLLVRYRTGIAGPQAATESFTPDSITLDLLPNSKEYIVPGSVQFAWMGTTYVDFEGAVYRNRTDNNPGTISGTINYTSGIVQMFDFVSAGSASNLAISSLWTARHPESTAVITFAVDVAPVRPSGLVFSCLDMFGTQLIGSSAINGNITGTHINGKIDYESGLVEIMFGDYVIAATLTDVDKAEWWYDVGQIGLDGKIWRPHPVDAQTMRYNAVSYVYLPLNAATIGIDPVRLPSDGRVAIFRPANVVVIHNTGAYTLPNPVLAETVHSVGRGDLSDLWLIDQLGARVPANQYTYNLTTGALTLAAGLNLSGYVQPLVAKHRVEDMALVTDVQITGQLTLAAALPRAYDAGTTFVSSALLFGDVNARVTDLTDYLAFTSWTTTNASGATAQFNDIDYPIEIRNDGAITEDWRINFTSTTSYQVIGKNLGVIATGTTAADCAPVAALTGKTYFVIRAAAWGAGWAAGNQLRFNTIGASSPIWIARTVLSGAALGADSFSLQMRGDVDAA